LSLQASAALKSRRVLPAEHAFFLVLSQQVCTAVPEVKNGKFQLPDESDLRRLVDWKAVEKFRI
jgi:hypothetical protein